MPKSRIAHEDFRIDYENFSETLPGDAFPKGADWLMALCPTVNAQVLDELCGLPDRHQVARLVVYAPRPKAMAALLAEHGIEAQVHAMRQALIQGQGGRQQ